VKSTSRRRGIKIVTQRLFLLAFGGSLAVILGEVLIRLAAPQPLNGFWTIDTPTGLRANKSRGTSRHQFGTRVVYYHFFPPHLRDTPIKNDGLRILMLGDSFTFGWLLDQEDTYVHHLQERADAEFGAGVFQFLNAGVGGWGAADYLAYVEEFGDLVRPDIVLVFLNTDDIGRSLRYGLYEFAGSNTQELVRRRVPDSGFKHVAKRTPGCQFLLEHSHLAQFIRFSVATLRYRVLSRQTAKTAQGEAAPASSSGSAGQPEASVLFGRALFLRLQSWCTARDAVLYVTTTGRHNPAPPDSAADPTRAFMAQAAEFFRDAQIPYCDISPAFLALPEQERLTHSIQKDGHPSPRGSRFIAEQVWQEFLRARLTQYLQTRRGGPAEPDGSRVGSPTGVYSTRGEQEYPGGNLKAEGLGDGNATAQR
jgi:hypothetical protein